MIHVVDWPQLVATARALGASFRYKKDSQRALLDELCGEHRRALGLPWPPPTPPTPQAQGRYETGWLDLPYELQQHICYYLETAELQRLVAAIPRHGAARSSLLARARFVRQLLLRGEEGDVLRLAPGPAPGVWTTIRIDADRAGFHVCLPVHGENHPVMGPTDVSEPLARCLGRPLHAICTCTKYGYTVRVSDLCVPGSRAWAFVCHMLADTEPVRAAAMITR